MSSPDIKALKALAHHLRPVVMIGSAGLSDAVMREIDLALSAHELIKVQVAGDDREARKAMAETICEALTCLKVQAIGKQLVLYRIKPMESKDDKPEKFHTPKKLLEKGIKSGGKARAGVKSQDKAKRRLALKNKKPKPQQRGSRKAGRRQA